MYILCVYILYIYIIIYILCTCPINLWVIVCMMMDLDIKTQNDSIDFYRGGFYFDIPMAMDGTDAPRSRISSDPLHLPPSAAAVPVCSVTNRPRC